MNKPFSYSLYFLLSLPGILLGQSFTAQFDTTIPFWGSVTNAGEADSKQGWARNSAIAPNAGETYLNSQMMDNVGMVIRFDLTGVSASTVNAPGFRATLDLMFHGFALDANASEGSGAVTPPEFAGHAGDGFTYISAYGMQVEVFNDSNRYMQHSTSGAFLNWDGTVPTNIAEATGESGNFNPSLFTAVAADTIAFTHGWGSAVSGATEPNKYGELVFDVTELVQNWVNGTSPNHGFFITTESTLSYGEQVNFLTMETDNRPEDGINAAGDAAPLLHLAIVPEPSTYAMWFGFMVFGIVFLRQRRRS